MKNYIQTNLLWSIITFYDALITFWVFTNCSDVLTQIEESEVCHLTDWIKVVPEANLDLFTSSL